MLINLSSAWKRVTEPQSPRYRARTGHSEEKHLSLCRIAGRAGVFVVAAYLALQAN